MVHTPRFFNFETFYGLLHDFIDSKSNIIHGLNLDVEEPITFDQMSKLFTRLLHDFPKLELSFAPVLSEVLHPTEPGAFSGFPYQKVFDTFHKHIAYIAVQMYDGSCTLHNWLDLTTICTLEPWKIMAGVEAVIVVRPRNFNK